jgi:ribosomal protein S26
MSQRSAQRQTCHACGTTVDVEAAVKIVVQRGDEQVWTVLCPDCASVQCDHCGHEVPVEEAVFPASGPEHRSVSTTTCAKCGDQVPMSKAAELRQENDPGYSKTLCPECLGNVGVPPGFYVERDLGS